MGADVVDTETDVVDTESWTANLPSSLKAAQLI